MRLSILGKIINLLLPRYCPICDNRLLGSEEMLCINCLKHLPLTMTWSDPYDKAQELARQQQDILMLRQQMDQRLKDLQDAERKMKDMIREAKDLEDKKIRNLIQMYANMKPRTAAKALESMDERVAIRILSGMAPKQSGEILTYTNPAKTAKFTELITRMRLPD